MTSTLPHHRLGARPVAIIAAAVLVAAVSFVGLTSGLNTKADAAPGDTTLLAWGHNYNGQLGLGDHGTGTNRDTPTQVGTATNWTAIDSGGDHAAAIKADGTLWTWGKNLNGQLGLGDTTDRDTPTQIGTATNWTTIATGGNHTAAIKTDGTLWTWGYNLWGQLGQGDHGSGTDRDTPTQIGTATNWTTIAAGGNHTGAIKADGTLWTWGANGSGRLGLGDTTDRYTPTQVGTATNWTTIATGGGTTAAIKTDDTLWTWGYNGSGQLGLGDHGSGADRDTPTQVGTATNWTRIALGGSHTGAIKTDGTLWTWGNNSSGELGLGDTTNRDTPTQVGTATNWTDIAAGSGSKVAIQTDNTPASTTTSLPPSSTTSPDTSDPPATTTTPPNTGAVGHGPTVDHRYRGVTPARPVTNSPTYTG